MGDVDYEQPQDDFEVEVTSLDEQATSANAEADTPQLAHSPLKPRFSPRQHRLQFAITASIVVLTLLVILGSTGPVRDLTTRALFGPTPTPKPTLAPGENLFYIEGIPAWAHVFIDGHVLSRLPIIGTDQPLQLARGTHQILWRANPFKPQNCTVSVPGKFDTDTCSYRETTQLKSGLLAWVIRFSISLNTLPDNQRAALIQATQAALDAQRSTETVLPGELYAVLPENPGLPCTTTPPLPVCFDTAKQPLRATLHFQLDTVPRSDVQCTTPGLGPGCDFLGQDCRLFCSNTTEERPSSREWDVFAVVRLLWDYATEDGHIIARDQPDTFIQDAEIAHFVPLQITWNGAGTQGWHVTALFTETNGALFPYAAICDSAWDEVFTGGFLGDVILNNTVIPLQWRFATGTVPAAGCVAVASQAPTQDPTPTPSTSPPLMAYCLQRFGVLLAAKDLAHRFWPNLPVADAYEQKLAKQLVAQNGINTN